MFFKAFLRYWKHFERRAIKFFWMVVENSSKYIYTHVDLPVICIHFVVEMKVEPNDNSSVKIADNPEWILSLTRKCRRAEVNPITSLQNTLWIDLRTRRKSVFLPMGVCVCVCVCDGILLWRGCDRTLINVAAKEGRHSDQYYECRFSHSLWLRWGFFDLGLTTQNVVLILWRPNNTTSFFLHKSTKIQYTVRTSTSVNTVVDSLDTHNTNTRATVAKYGFICSTVWFCNLKEVQNFIPTKKEKQHDERNKYKEL